MVVLVGGPGRGARAVGSATPVGGDAVPRRLLGTLPADATLDVPRRREQGRAVPSIQVDLPLTVTVDAKQALARELGVLYARIMRA
ncbi:hypothetical protein GCM10027047_26580 [Rhodococcus aerolatus]